MADSEKTIRLKIELEIARAKSNIKGLESQIEKLDMRFTENKVKAKQLALEYNKLADSKSRLAQSSTNVSTKLDQVKTASGGATSSVLEMGRVISDSNYGIRGVANNLSQLATNLVYTAKSAGGLAAGMGQIWKALMGPLGILLLFQAAIAYLEKLSLETGKAEKSFADFSSKGVTEAVAKLSLLEDVINDTTLSLEEQTGVLEAAKTEFKELGKASIETADDLDITTKAIDKMKGKLFELAFAQSILQESQEKLAAYTKQQAAGAQMSTIEKFLVFATQTGPASIFKQNVIAGAVEDATPRFEKEGERLKKQYFDILEMLKKPQEFGEGLLAELVFGKDDKSGGKAVKMFKEQTLKLEKFIISQNRANALIVEKNEVKQLDIKQKYAKEDLDNTKQTFIDKQRLRLEDFKKKNDDDEKIAEAEAVFRKMKEDAEDEHQRALTALETLHLSQRIEKRLELIRGFNERMLEARVESAGAYSDFVSSTGAGTSAGSVGKPMSAVGAEGVDTQTEAMKAAGVIEEQQFEEALEAKKEQLKLQGMSELQVKMELGHMQYQFDLDQATREIELEQMKIDAKKNINLEYVSWVSSLSSTFKRIAGDNEGLAKAALALEKGSKIASIVISTQAANQQVLVAASARAMLGDPTAVKTGKLRVLKNNIGAGLSIANILATGLNNASSPSSGSGGAGSGGGESREFDFNLVGSTGVNQLAQGIGGQFDQPIQAYVVSSQMTSQQQLDNVIQSSATIGD